MFQNVLLAYNPANQLQRLDTVVMEYVQCVKAHKDSGSPIKKDNNICAGGDEGMLYDLLKIWYIEDLSILHLVSAKDKH